MHLLKLMWYLVSEVCKLARLLFGGEKCAARCRTRPAAATEGAMIRSDSKSANRARTHHRPSFIPRSIHPLCLLCSLPILLMAVTRRPFRVIFSHFPLVRILPPPPPALGPPPAGRGGSGVPGAAEASISAVPGKSEEYGCTVQYCTKLDLIPSRTHCRYCTKSP